MLSMQGANPWPQCRMAFRGCGAAVIDMRVGMKCDKCQEYEWYYDYCKKWQCKVDHREVHNCFAPRNSMGHLVDLKKRLP